MRGTVRNMSRKLDESYDIVPYKWRTMRAGKSEFAVIGAESLTIGLHRTLGTRGNFNEVARY